MPVLRPAIPEDVADLARFAQEMYVDTFVRGFGIAYPEADLDAFLAETCSPEAFAAMAADPAYDVRLLRDAAGVAAYAVAGPPSLPHPDVRPAHGEIKRFYLRPDQQSSGLARAALEELLRDLDPEGRRTLWLSVWEGNVRAQRFYARYGFEKAGTYDYPVGAHIDLDFIYRRG